ncbi:unnamed protein product [Phaedon cochleariae]|uniref:Inhibitor of growth protein N-terminal histone-binding domain-containing protein n=1 Tax=Phaedon cochleariae TaxID=80249 RepID=A0A9N9SI20_PHACE|nr:unnamed protein product [Phaedon cochleariae]
MLYLEDYLEMIEHLPQELRDRFTDMREMDLGIHNNMDELEKRVKLFFNDCKRYSLDNLPQNVDTEFQSIRKEYYKNLEDADEKVHLASQMYDLVDKYLRRLDSELYKFKCELEADNKGITEVLEKRSLELDTPNTTPSIALLQQKENRYDRLSVLFNPDRVDDVHKEIATEKFKALGKIHSILQNPDKHNLYNKSGQFDDEMDTFFNCMDYWRNMFKKIEIKDIQKYEQEYTLAQTLNSET